MWSGGGESGLGNMFNSGPAFPESGIHQVIVHVLNITWVICLKRVTVVGSIQPYCSILLCKRNRAFTTGCLSIPCPNQYSDLEAIASHIKALSELTEMQESPVYSVTQLYLMPLWKKSVDIFLKKENHSFPLGLFQEGDQRENKGYLTIISF